jgi:predicted kinase
MPFYLIVRGPLGAGKTTVAGALAESIAGRVVSIDAILEEMEWDGGSESLFLRANEVATRKARDALDHGVPVVFDGNFYWQSALDDLAGRLPFPHRVFRLDVPLEVCVERDRHRAPSYGEEATREVFEKVARVRSGIPIDGSRPVAEIVRAMVSRIPRGWRVR